MPEEKKFSHGRELVGLILWKWPSYQITSITIPNKIPMQFFRELKN